MEYIRPADSFLVMIAAAGLDDATVILSVRASDSGERFQDSVIRHITVYYREPAPITLSYIQRLLVGYTDTTLSVARLLVSGGRVFADGTYQLSLINRQNAPTGEDAFINDDNVVIVNAPLAGFLTLTAQAQDEHPSTEAQSVIITMQIADFLTINLRQSAFAHVGARSTLAQLTIIGGYAPDGYAYSLLATTSARLHNSSEFGIIITVNPASAGLITVTAVANDDLLLTPPATAILTSRAVREVSLSGGEVLYLPLDAQGRVLTILNAEDGVSPYFYRLLPPLLPYLNLESAGWRLRVSAPPIERILSTVQTFVEVSDISPQGFLATATLRMLIEPSSLVLTGNFAAAVAVGALATAGMITVSGGLPFGDGSYRISVLDSGAAGADVGVALLEDNIAAITALVTARLTATIIADDNYARMPPVSLFFTLNPLVPLSLDSEFLGGRVTASVARGILRLQLSGGLPPVSAALVNFNNVPRFVDGLDITVSTKLDNVGLYTARVVLAAADAAEVDVAFLQRARRFEYATTLTVVTPPPIVADWSDQLFVLARAAEGQYAGLLSISGGSVLAAGYSISVFVDSESQLSAHYVRITSSAGFDGFERGSVVFDADAAGSYFGNITASIVINDIRGDTTPIDTFTHCAGSAGCFCIIDHYRTIDHNCGRTTAAICLR